MTYLTNTLPTHYQNGEITLKPCPKCGERAQTFSNLEETEWATGCYKCHLWSRAKTADESRVTWTRRAEE